MTQAMSAGKTRAVSIVPAVPRKFERKTQPSTKGTSRIEADAKEPEQSGKDLSEHSNHVMNESNLGPANPEEVEEEVSKTSKGASVIVQNTGEDSVEKPTANSQDFGIEKHGFKLPPPFYPTHPPPVVSPVKQLTLAEQPILAEPQLPFPGTTGSEEEDSAAKQFVSNSSSPLPSNSPFVAPHSNPTRLEDTAPSPTDSSYQGYAHARFAPFYPQPTPPTEASTSPAHSADQGYDQAHSISFYPTPNSSFNDTSSSTQSSYQGYTYGHSGAHSQASHQPFDQSQRQLKTFAPSNNEYGSGLPYYNQAPVFSPIGSHPPLTPSATPLNSAPIKSPDDLSSYQHPTNDNASNANVVPSNVESPRHTASGIALGYGDSLFSATSNFDAAGIDPALEIWRTSKMESLRQFPLDIVSTQNSLSKYLLQRFNSIDSYADCCLQIAHKFARFQKTKFWVHSLLLAQSPKLQGLLNNSEVGSDGKRFVYLEMQDHFSTPSAIGSALRVLYGELPHTFTGYPVPIEPSKAAADVAKSWMDNTLAFAAAGQVLQLQSVVARGMQVAAAILTWDNLERAFSFTLDRELSQNWDKSTYLLSFNFSATAPSSFDFPQARMDTSEDLLYACLCFLIANCPSSWILDVTARPIAHNDRLPITAGSRSPLSKSRLSRLQFGDHPSEIHAKLKDPNTILSSILLSAPFAIMKYLLDHFEESIKRRSSMNVVIEREARRQKVLQSHSISSAQKQAAADVWAEVGWKEFVVEEEDSGVSFGRKWVGF